MTYLGAAPKPPAPNPCERHRAHRAGRDGGRGRGRRHAICRQFREIHDKSGRTPAYTASFKAAILNARGRLRSWQFHQVAHSLWNQHCYSYPGALEALSGMNVDVEFLGFEDLKRSGIPADVGVIINAGDAGSA